jgi:hypothetical protein
LLLLFLASEQAVKKTEEIPSENTAVIGLFSLICLNFIIGSDTKVLLETLKELEKCDL